MTDDRPTPSPNDPHPTDQLPQLSINDAAVLNYLTSLQSLITRLAANSSSCKTLCVTIVSAIIVVITKQEKPQYIWVALLPIASLGLLDAYYLSLEQGVRTTYNLFTTKLCLSLTVNPADLFKMAPTFTETIDSTFPRWRSRLTITCCQILSIGKAICSFSVFGFYLPLAAIAYFGRQLIFS